MSSAETKAGAVEPIRATVIVAVPPARAWEVFTGEMQAWWPSSTHSVAAGEGSSPDAIVVEPYVGGEIYELIGPVRRSWARIHTWEPPRRLGYSWHVNPKNPATDVAVTFVAVDEGTRVEVVHGGWEAYGALRDEQRTSYRDGWPTVLADFAQAFSNGSEVSKNGIRPVR